MKRILYLLAMLAFILSGCTENNDPPSVQPDIEQPDKPVEVPDGPPTPQVFHADPSSFHFIADWLDESKILYVVKNDGAYQVNSYDIKTGEIGLVYEDDSFIIDVLVHPSRDYFLVHTSDSANAAVVKMIGMDGTVRHQVEIDSTELAIEWNRMNPEKILFTAFHEDWSFDLFAFDGNEEHLSLVELDDPFPKWAGDDQIIGMLFEGHPLDGGELQLFRLDTGQIKDVGIGNVIYFDVFEDSFVAVQSIDENVFSYSVRKFDSTLVAGWTLPSVSNYSEWVVPTIEWLDHDRLLLAGAEKNGQLDEMGTGFNLYHFDTGDPELLLSGLDGGPLKCSPAGQYCLSGFSLDELIDIDAKKKHKWIEIDN